MNQTSPSVVGLVPWLPWPLSHWPWWTEPVRAERLALLRIGIALCLLVDIGIHYVPEMTAYYAIGGLGDPAVHDWGFQAPHMTWSLLRGVGDPTMRSLSFGIWVAATCWIVGVALLGLVFVRSQPPRQDQSGIALWIWTAAFAVYTAGLCSELLTSKGDDHFLAWVVPLAGFSIACLFCALELLMRWRDRTHRIRWLPLVFALLAPLVLAGVGVLIGPADEFDKTVWWFRLLRPWQEDAGLLTSAMCLWIASAFLLLIGCATRFSAVLTYLISMSFASLNPHVDNAGVTIRTIILFYMMLCPAGAVWSIDALWRKKAEPVFVHPWPIRLLFVQLILMYFMNGVYKLFGTTWQEGSSLHYVLGDITLARFSAMDLPLPYVLTQVMTWSVVTWEASFPLLVLWKWPRRVALTFGVMFHLGIFVSMELANFAPYALCLYLPLLPWENSQGTTHEVSGTANPHAS